MAKPNYQFEKRQRDLAKKAKQEEKRLHKLANKTGTTGGADDALPDDEPAPTQDNATPSA